MTAKKSDYHAHPASFRDPSGFIFQTQGCWYRQVNVSYHEDYRLLMDSGLYPKLREKELLIAHEELQQNLTGQPDWFLTLKPEQLPFITYPEEWSPAQLKDAALCTLTILLLAIEHGMILKDATPRNIQFLRGKPLFIDTLSFEKYDPIQPWIAYRQFCECFLYPLLLHHYRARGTHKTLIAWPEGIPAPVVTDTLPGRSRLRLSTWLHVLLPARMARTRLKPAGHRPERSVPAFSREKLLRLIDHLTTVIRKLDLRTAAAEGWSNYYEHTILSEAYLHEKERLFREYLNAISFRSALDLGANNGHFSRIMAEKAERVIAADADWACIQQLYGFTRDNRISGIYPLCIDLANPTPASGFHHQEKTSFTERAESDLVVALALVHHLVLAQNIPLPLIASWLATLTGRWLLVEFVPAGDPKARELLAGKPTYPGPYDRSAFEACFLSYFQQERMTVIPGTERVIYLLQKKTPL